MIQFNELRITEDSKCLIIDVSVIDEPYYKDVYITGIAIDNQRTFIPNSYQHSGEGFQYPEDDVLNNEEIRTKHLRVILKEEDFIYYGQDGKKIRNISLRDLLFVYVLTTGTPTEDAPCKYIDKYPMATVVNMYPFYQEAMYNIKEVTRNCSVSPNFTNYILRLKALELAIRTCNYEEAIKYFKWFFSGKLRATYSKGGCACGT